MVEEFMSGAEVSVEAMTVNGKTEIISITDKYITQPPYFVEIAHSEPSRLGEKYKRGYGKSPYRRSGRFGCRTAIHIRK